MSVAWTWYGEDADKEAVVVPSVQAIAVYTNPDGDIVIRQQDPMGQDDAVVVIPRAMVGRVVKALRTEAAKKLEPEQD